LFSLCFVWTKYALGLPNIPSATEVKKDGVQLGEMSNLLLVKIEELTLHIIELKKEIEQLKNDKNQKTQ